MTPTNLLTADTPRRPSFRDGQVLRAGDLRADDAEHTRAGRRHAGMVHAPGLVAGLWLSAEEEDTNVIVSPGMAIDGAGRSILVGRSRSVPIPDSKAEYEVWLAARRGTGRCRFDERSLGAAGPLYRDVPGLVLPAGYL